MVQENVQISNLTIRPLKIEDTIGIRKMQADAWADVYPNKEAKITRQWVVNCTAKWFSLVAVKASIEHFKDIINNPDKYYYRVVLDKNKLLGDIFMSKISGVQCLESLYLDKTLHGKKIAQKLLDEALEWVDSKKPVVLEVARYNSRAIAFYNKYNFEIEKGSEHIFWDKIPVVNMARKGGLE